VTTAVSGSRHRRAQEPSTHPLPAFALDDRLDPALLAHLMVQHKEIKLLARYDRVPGHSTCGSGRGAGRGQRETLGAGKGKKRNCGNLPVWRPGGREIVKTESQGTRLPCHARVLV
jgi:hypothetical protein